MASMLTSVRRRLSGLAFAGAAAVIIFQIACPVVIAAQGSHLAVGRYSTQSDAARYRAIAETPGTPYRDFKVEYPPLAVGLFHTLGPRHFSPFRQRLLVLQIICQGLIVLLMFRVWGKRAGWSYLVLSTPMLFVVYTGFDLVGVALAVGAAALVRGRRPTSGAIGFVIGAFMKLWPVVLLPSLLARRRTRSFLVGTAIGVVGLAMWTAWGGSGAIGQVVGYRGARGWEYESIPGSLLRLFTHDTVHLEQGSLRLGAPPEFLAVLLSIGLVGALCGIWWVASRRPQIPEGVAECAAVTSLLVLGTLLSPQFVIWSLPFAAIAAGAGATRLEGWAGAAAGLTFLDWIFFFDPNRAGFLRSESIILGRNVALVGLLVVAVLEVRRTAPARRPIPA